jgi:hypothetical protein
VPGLAVWLAPLAAVGGVPRAPVLVVRFVPPAAVGGALIALVLAVWLVPPAAVGGTLVLAAVPGLAVLAPVFPERVTVT